MNDRSVFPKNFYWGAATSAFQVEGGITGMDWEKAAQEGRVPHIGRAADHYNRFEEDFDIAMELGHNAHRFSIEWARIEPEEGKFDANEIEHYRTVLRALRERNIEPFITLWHFTLPLWFSESGGFERKDSPEIFARYCAYVAEQLGDLCTHFATINEPNVYAGHGYIYGAWPPFKRLRILWKKIGKEDGTSERARPSISFFNLFAYLRVTKNLTRAHNAAYESIKAAVPNAVVSVVKHVRYFHANKNPMNILLARFMQYVQTEQFMHAVADHLDEIGLNYYRSTKFGDNKAHAYSDMGWKMEPQDIYGALMVLKQFRKPIVIAEAGVADAKDAFRADYIRGLVEGMHRAIVDGVDLRGYMYWSLLDNYELALGYEKRFGLVEVDYNTLERRIRPSAYIYKKIIEQNGIVDRP